MIRTSQRTHTSVISGNTIYNMVNEYMREMIQNWLRISAVIDTEDLLSDAKDLQRKAKLIGNVSSTWIVQHSTLPYREGGGG